jgi:hypothetical protein
MDAESQNKPLQLLKSKTRNLYNSFENPIWCTSLKSNVYFNAQGFHHLLYDGLGRKRSQKQQEKRLNFVQFIPSIIKNASIESYRKVESHRTGSKEVKYWALRTYINKDAEIRIVIKQIGSGNRIFWSAIPL